MPTELRSPYFIRLPCIPLLQLGLASLPRLFVKTDCLTIGPITGKLRSVCPRVTQEAGRCEIRGLPHCWPVAMGLQTWTEIHCWREGDVMDTPMSHAHVRCSPKCHRSLRVNSCDTHSQSRFLGVGGGPRAASSFSCRPVTHRGRRRHNRPSCSACHSRQAGLSAQNKVLTGDGWNANVLLEMNASSHRNWSNRHIESLVR